MSLDRLPMDYEMRTENEKKKTVRSTDPLQHGLLVSLTEPTKVTRQTPKA